MNTAFSDIADLDTYNARMGKGVMDKMFFVDKIDPESIIDFGCADGCMIEHLRPWFPDAKFVGYDSDPKMIEVAKNRITPGHLTPAFFTTNWSEALVSAPGKTAVLLSSIVHEIYHYQEPHEVDAFWKRIFDPGFDYIVFRDMIPARSIDRPSDINDVARIYRKFLNTNQLQDFENKWGSIENNRNLTHFLLKYKYLTPNWDREVKENYLPLYREDLLAMIPSEYDVLYHEHYVLPYIKRSVKADLGIEMKDPTHLKLILERGTP